MSQQLFRLARHKWQKATNISKILSSKGDSDVHGVDKVSHDEPNLEDLHES